MFQLDDEKIKLIMSEFSKFKTLIDNFPKSFSVRYDEENGYYLTMDLDSLKSHLAAED